VATKEQTYVALLRAVNVAGQRKVPMSQLRTTLEGLGYGNVRTYLQSGNAVFTGHAATPSAVARRVEGAIFAGFGFEVDVVVLTDSDLAKIAKTHPFAAEDDDPTHLFASFLLSSPDPALVAAFDVSKFLPERAVVVGQVVFLHYPLGAGVAKLSAPTLERQLGKLRGTARNWRTVQALVAMTAPAARTEHQAHK
jgi:uncharacterized protein (DUF1697 family)